MSAISEQSTAVQRVGQERHPSTRYWTAGGPVESELLQPDDLSAIRERSGASLADPTAFALFGLGVGTFLIGFPISGFIPGGALAGTLAPMLVLAGVVQFIGGLFALRRGDAFTGTTFTILGGHYGVLAAFMIGGATLLPAVAATSTLVVALELYCFGYIALVLGAAAMRRNLSMTIALLALVPGYVLTGMTIWYPTSMPGVATRIGGYCLIAAAAFAAYAATATLFNSMMQRAVMPVPAGSMHRPGRMNAHHNGRRRHDGARQAETASNTANDNAGANSAAGAGANSTAGAEEAEGNISGASEQQQSQD